MRAPALRLFVAGLVASITTGCVTMAAPPPVATLGGPSVVSAGHSEVGIGVGSGASLFPGAHTGGDAWLGRWRQGLGSGFDLGLDALGARHADKGTFTFKVAGRCQLGEHTRLEAGVGGADDSDGKSLNADLALTLGTTSRRSWNFYTSLRLAAAKGFPGDLFGTGTTAPPDDVLGIAAVGASGRISNTGQFVAEAGIGPALVRGTRDIGVVIYVGAGLLFDVGPAPENQRTSSRAASMIRSRVGTTAASSSGL
jgi:hypothetical protein